jgi:hypothetical protein
VLALPIVGERTSVDVAFTAVVALCAELDDLGTIGATTTFGGGAESLDKQRRPIYYAAS